MLGFPDDIADWQEYHRNAVDSTIEDGLRMVYTPPPIPPWPPHSWSFLFPTTEITLEANTRWYPLPDDFGSFAQGEAITFADDGDTYPPIKITSESYLRRMESLVDTTAIPVYAAPRLIQSGNEDVDRWELGFDPTPNSQYRVSLRYHATPRMIHEDAPYPVGGAVIPQSILLACLAAAEEREYDQRGPRYESFVTQLRADIEEDSRRGPNTVGYNTNGGSEWPASGWPGLSRDSRRIPKSLTTYRDIEWG